MNLIQYFSAPHYKRALDRYAQFATEVNWPVSLKWEMYQAAQTVFDSSSNESQKRSAFDTIFSNVKNWGAFRGSPLETCWSLERILDALLGAECDDVSRRSQLTLITLMHSD